MSEQELRHMVREILREALGKRTAAGAETMPANPQSVRIASDADLAAFVRRILGLLDNPATAAAIRTGALRFRLEGNDRPPSAPPVAAVETKPLGGTVTEARVNKLSGVGVIVLAPDAVITPLARDRARALGLRIERRR